MKLLDIGCGCLRGGIHFIKYLDIGNYYGIDASQKLLNAGYDIELAIEGLQPRLPRKHLFVNDEFKFSSFNTKFNIAIAQSLFTHLPLSHIKLCLANLAHVMLPGTRAYMTFFLCKNDQQWASPLVHTRGGITTYPNRNPYHYCLTDIEGCIATLPWKIVSSVDWNHPRDQKMIGFKRINN